MRSLRSVKESESIRPYQTRWLAESYVRDILRHGPDGGTQVAKFVIESPGWRRFLSVLHQRLSQTRCSLYSPEGRRGAILLTESLTREHIKTRVEDIKRFIDRQTPPSAS